VIIARGASGELKSYAIIRTLCRSLFSAHCERICLAIFRFRLFNRARSHARLVNAGNSGDESSGFYSGSLRRWLCLMTRVREIGFSSRDDCLRSRFRTTSSVSPESFLLPFYFSVTSARKKRRGGKILRKQSTRRRGEEGEAKARRTFALSECPPGKRTRDRKE